VIADLSGGVDVYFSGRLVGSALIVSRDTAVDLAVLRVTGLERAGARALSWGDSTTLASGDQIVVLGYPSIVGLTVTAGIVSGVKRLGSSDLVQTDAAVNHGNSGGPMLNDRGELVAIADFIISNAVGLNFGIATSTARPFFDRASR
jgi:S1-C subfamily serine protease